MSNSISFDEKGFLRLNKKMFRKKDRDTVAIQFEKYNVKPLVQAVETHEKKLFESDINELSDLENLIKSGQAELNDMREKFVAKHTYITTGTKSLEKNEVLEALAYIDNVYTISSNAVDKTVECINRLGKGIDGAEKAEAKFMSWIEPENVDYKECKTQEEVDKKMSGDCNVLLQIDYYNNNDYDDGAEYLNKLNAALRIDRTKGAFYNQMDNGSFGTLKTKILKYHKNKEMSESSRYDILYAITAFLTIPFACIPARIFKLKEGYYGLATKGDKKYQELRSKDVEKALDCALAYQIKVNRLNYIRGMWFTIFQKAKSINEQAEVLIHTAGDMMLSAASFMPEQYRNFDDCQNLHRILKEGYADNIREAYLVYENERMRQELDNSERQRKEQTLAMLNVLAKSVETVAAASDAAFSASEMAISTQEKLIDARREAEETNKRIAAAEKKNAENKVALDKIKREVKDIKDNK